MEKVLIPKEHLDLFVVPSASQLERVLLCEGSWLLEQSFPEPPQNKAAELGTKIHALMAARGDEDYEVEENESLSGREEFLLQSLTEHEEKVLGELGFDPFDVAGREIPLGYYNEENRLSFTGRPDVFYMSRDGSRLAVVDYKTGMNPVTEIHKNIQVAVYVVLAYHYAVSKGAKKIKSVSGVIIQPLAEKKIAVVDYSLSDIAAAEKTISALADKAKQQGLGRTPGEKQCQYCKARAFCPESIAFYGQRVASLPIVPSQDFKKEQLQETIVSLSGGQLAMILDNAKYLLSMISEVTERSRELLQQDPESIPGYSLKEGNSTRKINNVVEVYKKMKSLFDVDPEMFLSLCSLGIGNVQDFVKSKLKVSEPVAKVKVNEYFEEAITFGQNKPSVVKKK